MKIGALRNSILFLSFLTGIISCKKTGSTNPPAWFSAHSRFYYDYTTDTSFTPNYHLLTVTKQPSPGELFFYESATDTSATSSPEIFLIFRSGILEAKDDGLYNSATTDCRVGIINNSFDFLSIPAAPKTGDALPQYGCGHSDEGYNRILIADTVITVPAGTYHTFCIVHENGDRSFWNRDAGIIRYEQWEHDLVYPFRRLGVLELRGME